MKQLAAITAFITSLNLVAAEQVDGWVENPKIVPSATSKGVGGMILFRQTYTAVLIVERYPHKVHPAELLFAHISAWLIDNDGDRFDDKDAEITTDVDILDDETADITISIDFIEEVGITEDPAGPITLAGIRYRLGNPIIHYALEGDLHEPVDWVGEAP
ncbi:MAG: phage tail protein [Methylococcales bacterium]